MVKKKSRVEPLSKDMPVYTIGVASQLLDVHPRTLRIYENEGLIKPHRKGSRRLYSPNDLQWISCIRSLIHDQGISIPGIKKLLRFATCYEISECPESIHCSCEAVVDRVIPRKLRVLGSSEEERAAAALERSERARTRQQKKDGKEEDGLPSGRAGEE